jgi:hypothetical protein
MDIEKKAIEIIKSIKIYEKQDNPALKPSLRPCVADTFRAICASFGKEDTKSPQIHNLQMSEKHLRAYLIKRY